MSTMYGAAMKTLTALLASLVLVGCSAPAPDKFDATIECRKLIRDQVGSSDVDFRKTIRTEKGDQAFQIMGSLTDADGATRAYDCTVKAKSGGGWEKVDLFVGDPL